MDIGAAGTNGVGYLGSLGLDPGAFISPDALLVYCETRLRGLDTQIKSSMAQQEKANSDSSALTDLSAALSSCSGGGIHPAGGDNNHAGSDLVRAYQAAIMKVGPDSPLGMKLRGEQSKLMDQVGGNVRDQFNANKDIWDPNMRHDDGAVRDVNAAEIQKSVENVRDMQKNLNAGSELTMINLQSIMSQRQTAVQLTTNLVQSLGDQMNKIAANIGH